MTMPERGFRTFSALFVCVAVLTSRSSLTATGITLNMLSVMGVVSECHGR